MNYASFAFTDSIKRLQTLHGSRASYGRMESFNSTSGLTDNEVEFITDRDSFYLASIGENGYPYIQHRGGPPGFVKVLDNTTLGMLDFSGNKQYISVGNALVRPQVSLIMVSYPHKARLKIYADVRMMTIDEDPELHRTLSDIGDYKHRAERMMLFDIKAYDWNCPQHITPRFTQAEIEHAFAPQQHIIQQLEAENNQLKQQLQLLQQ